MSCFYIRKTKKIIRRNLIVMAKLQKMTDRKLVSTTFVTGIHGLGSSEYDKLKKSSARHIIFRIYSGFFENYINLFLKNSGFIFRFGDYMDYIQRMRNLREDHDKTQQEIADVLGTSQTMYARYERGAISKYMY